MRFQKYKYFFLIAIVGILSAAFHGLGLLQEPPWHIVYSDIVPFFEEAVKPGIPYIDKTVEYPVLTGFFIHLMGMIGGSAMGYYIASAFFLILFAGITTFFLYQIAKNLGREDRVPWFWIFAPSMLIFMIYNWDIIALMFVAAAFYFACLAKPWRSGAQHWQDYAAAAMLGLGFSAKFFPILYLVPLLLSPTSNVAPTFDVGRIAKILVLFIATVLAVNGIFMLANFDAWSYFFTFNSARSANPDSIWTVAQYLLGVFEVSTINTISLILFAASYGLFLFFFRNRDFLFLSFGATILFLFFNKIFSPQYLLWLLPFFVLLPIQKRWFYPLEFINLAALFSILAWFFIARENTFLYLTIFFVVLRHVALLGVFVHLVWAPQKKPKLARLASRGRLF